MSRIRLFLQQATEVVGADKEGLLILTDSYQERQLVVPCHGNLLEEFKSRLDKHRNHSGLIDILLDIINNQTSLSLSLIITDVDKGAYNAVINNEDTQKHMRISGVEAVLLNKISNDKIPLYIDEALFLRQSSKFNMQAEGVALPVNALPVSMLEKTLGKAVAAENYELASQLRDEINRRKKTDKHINNEIKE